MKIISWNTNHWQKKHLNEELWEYIDNVIDPDIALLQEAFPLNQISGFIGESVEVCPISRAATHLWRSISPSRKWGSGVFTKNLPIREVEIETNYKGALTVAEIKVKDHILTAVSLYGILEEGYSITTLHRIFSDLTLLLEGKLGGKRNIILAGDFNASPQFDEKQKGESHRILFERIENFGLVSLFPYNKEKPIQTWRRENSKVKWQLDHFFISKHLKGKISKTKILLDEKIKRLSDHNPMMIKLDL